MMQTKPMTVPLSQLRISPLNARHGADFNEGEIAALATSIAAVGLIHPLVAYRDDDGFAVIAGARRLTALLSLGDAAPAEVPVMLHEYDPDQLAQASVAENLQRAPMTDKQLLLAIKSMLAMQPRPTDEMLAQSLGVGERRVQRLVRLCHVHPTILDQYFEDQLERSELEAFARSPDPAEQLRVFEQYEANEISLHDVKRIFGFGDRGQAEQLAWVGRDAYTAAGGRIDADLFDTHDSNACRVVDLDILAKLANEKAGYIKRELAAKYPDKDITVSFEEPKGSDGYTDHNLRAYARYPEDTQERIDSAEAAIEDWLNLLGDMCGKRIFHWNSGDYLAKTGADMGLTGDVAANWDATVGLIKQTSEQLAELQLTEKLVPDAATLAVIELRNGNPSISWWYPDRAAAGQAAKPIGGIEPKPTPPKVGDDDYDPDSPELTQRASDYAKAMRVRAATRFLLDTENEASAAAARAAHRALIFATGWRLAQGSYVSTDETGLVHSFGGDSYGFAGAPLDKIDAPQIAGLRHKTLLAGWRKFDKVATDADVDRLAAWVFACKLQPSLDPAAKSLASAVLSDMGTGDMARRYSQPDLGLDFFKMFSKKVLGAFAATIQPEFAERVLAAKGEDVAKTAHEGLAGEDVTADCAGWRWLPTFLRWGK